MKRYLILTLLSLYVMAGLFLTPFHADESQHLALSRAYVAYFVIGDPWRLRVDPPIPIHSEAYLRLLDGTVSAYLTGFILWHSGRIDLENPHPAWYYPDDVAANRAAGRYPPPDLLYWGRLASALFTVGGVWVMDALGRRLGSSTAGLSAAMIFAFHPLILLNGRRVMQEGALMLFSLLVVWLGIRFAEQPTFKNSLLLGLVSGLALASKPTTAIAILGVGIGVGAVLVVTWLCGLIFQHRHGVGMGLSEVRLCRTESDPSSSPHEQERSDSLTLPKTSPYPTHASDKRTARMPSLQIVRNGLFSGTVAILIFLILTPAIWSNPPARLWLAAQLRRDALAGQTTASGDGYKNLWERGQALFTMPFPATIQYYESDDFAQDAGLQQEIRRYQAHWLRGVRLPAWIGMGLVVMGLIQPHPLTPSPGERGNRTKVNKPASEAKGEPSLKLFSIWKTETNLKTPLHAERGWGEAKSIILLCWLLTAALVTLIAVPLAWQRYYLPYLLPLILTAGLGLDSLWQTLVHSLRFHHAS